MNEAYWGKIWSVVALFLCLSGCRAELYHGLDEQAANEMVVVLHEHGIDADKTVDATDSEAWSVSVPDGVRVEAWRVLEAWGLPRPVTRGFSTHYPREGLVPTASEERILLQYATAQELRQSLLLYERVVDAKVNLVLPEKSAIRLRRDAEEPPRASVLIKYRGGESPPVDAADVRRLVAGGVERLDSGAVEVLMTRVREGERPLGKIDVVEVGPVSVASGSKAALQAFVGILVILVLGLSGALVLLLTRRRI